VPVTAGLLLAAAGLLALTGIEPGTPYSQLWWKLALVGAGLGLSISPATAAGVAAMPGTQAGVASAVISTSRQVGGALGVAVLGAVAAARYGAATPASDPAAFLAGVHAAYRVAAAALAVGAVAAGCSCGPAGRPGPGRPAGAAGPADSAGAPSQSMPWSRSQRRSASPGAASAPGAGRSPNWRPHTGQRHPSMPEASVPWCTISWGEDAPIGRSFLVRSWGWLYPGTAPPQPVR
jgi:hypothetical protein